VHGASTGPASNVPVLEQLAAAGYVVAMPKFPLTGEGTPGGPDPADYVHEPADVSFVINALLALTHDRHSVYHRTIRRHRIAVLGLSLGASAALALGYGTCCIDRRVDAVVSVSGAKTVPGLPAFPGTYSYPPTPLLLVRGAAPFDFAASFSEPVFAEAHAPKFLLTVTNGVHVPVLVNDAGGRTSLRAVTAFFDRYLKSRHHALTVLLDQGRDPSIATLRAVTR
jgi:predicted dienelactone hydrolase